ncbi:MAG: tetratricopeptide repeat protein [Acidobacteriia bacterium]|nr:tetratricopeptide repeat protein [Terriglobia bacterium]
MIRNKSARRPERLDVDGSNMYVRAALQAVEKRLNNVILSGAKDLQFPKQRTYEILCRLRLLRMTPATSFSAASLVSFLLLCASSSALARAQTVAAPPAADQAAALVTRGYRLLEQRDAAGAEAAFRQAIEIQPELAEAHRGLGMALWHRGEKTAGLRELTVASRLAPDNAEAHFELGKLAWTLSWQPPGEGETSHGLSALDYQATALAELSKAVALRPDDADLRLTLADVYLATGNKSGALDEARKAGELARTPALEAQARLLLGRAYHAVGEEGKAEEAFKAALEIDPRLAEAHLGLGQRCWQSFW